MSQIPCKSIRKFPIKWLNFYAISKWRCCLVCIQKLETNQIPIITICLIASTTNENLLHFYYQIHHLKLYGLLNCSAIAIFHPTKFKVTRIAIKLHSPHLMVAYHQAKTFGSKIAVDFFHSFLFRAIHLYTHTHSHKIMIGLL
jgi:hypothetical protein